MPSQQSDRKRAENTQSPGAPGTLQTGGHPGLVVAIKQEKYLIGNRPSHLQDPPAEVLTDLVTLVTLKCVCLWLLCSPLNP